MAWFRFDSSMPTHPKTEMLASLIGKDIPSTVGHLALLWCRVVDNDPDGNLQSRTDLYIEVAAKWDGDRGVFFNALVEVGFIDQGDGEQKIHGWAKRVTSYKEAQRKQKYREEQNSTKTTVDPTNVPGHHSENMASGASLSRDTPPKTAQMSQDRPTERTGQDREDREEIQQQPSPRSVNPVPLGAKPPQWSPGDPLSLLSDFQGFSQLQNRWPISVTGKSLAKLKRLLDADPIIVDEQLHASEVVEAKEATGARGQGLWLGVIEQARKDAALEHAKGPAPGRPVSPENPTHEPFVPQDWNTD